jgi:hypothetical protein
VDQRNLWKQYLNDNNLHAAQLLKDGVHQNEFGNYLMAEIVKAYLVPRKDTHIDPMQCAMVRTYQVGKDVTWKNGSLSLPFEGNRVDVIAGKGVAASAEIRIDGKKPSEIRELYGFTRALSTPGGKWPVILKMGSQKPLQVEEWTMHIAKDPQNDKLFTFTVTGSRTGPDGAGRSDQRFVSNSGRIVIDPADWNVEYSMSLPGIKQVPVAFEVHWKVVPYFSDSFVSTPDPTVESVITVAQGLSNGKHTLEIIGDTHTPLAAIRVYRPPYGDGNHG